jgi:crotonobetainyl-CoA:carnitine CoA-transferase CaiB-like acyl-CoA transferase
VNTLAEIVESDYARAREMVVTVGEEFRDGRESITVMGRPYKISDGPPTIRLGPPKLGEANHYVVHELLGFPEGYEKKEG